jgi:hypothetical protein
MRTSVRLARKRLRGQRRVATRSERADRRMLRGAVGARGTQARCVSEGGRAARCVRAAGRAPSGADCAPGLIASRSRRGERVRGGGTARGERRRRGGDADDARGTKLAPDRDGRVTRLARVVRILVGGFAGGRGATAPPRVGVCVAAVVGRRSPAVGSRPSGRARASVAGGRRQRARYHQRNVSSAIRIPAATPTTMWTPASARTGVASSVPRAVSRTGSSIGSVMIGPYP